MFKSPYKQLAGKSVVLLLNNGLDVLLKVTEVTPSTVKGYDDEGMNRTVYNSSIMDYYIPAK